MKTITLSEAAYERLMGWKESPKDSFSKVVERVVPPKGTLGSVLLAVKNLPPLSAAEEKLLIEASLKDRGWENQKDPWTT